MPQTGQIGCKSAVNLEMGLLDSCGNNKVDNIQVFFKQLNAK